MRQKSSTDATPAITAKSKKKSVSVSILTPQKDAAGLPSAGSRVASSPARMLLVALLMNHTPISSDAMRAGESLVTSDSPIGDSDNSPMVFNKKTGRYEYFTQAETDKIVATSYCDATGTKYTSLDDAIKKSSDMKVVGVTPESPEYYQEFYKLKTNEAFSEKAIKANMKTGRYKMAYEYGQMESSLDDIFADKAKRAKVLDECRRYVNREITELSDDTIKAIQMAEKQAECLHQVPKTYDLYIGKDINAQAYGAISGFSEESRLMVETCRMAENQGRFNIDLGELSDILEKRGTTYAESVSKMTLDFNTINTNCRVANSKAASGFMNLSPGSGVTGAVLGTSGSAGSAASNA